MVHGVLFFIVLWQVSNSSYTSAVDEEIMKKVNAASTKLFGSNAHYDHDFVFVNVSRDLKLVPDPAEYGEISITDRSKLAQFFKILADNGNKHHFVLSDIFPEYPEDDDSVLLAETKRCKKILFPYHLAGDSIIKPCVDVPSALSDFITNTGDFSKFKLLYGAHIKTTPVALLEEIDKKRYPRSYLDFTSVFPRYYIQPSQLFETKKYPYYNLGELLMLSEADSFYHKFLENKFIVIGNYETDVHNSAVGKMPGPLILLNTYLSIRNRGHISWWWALFMITGLGALSYLLFFKKVKAPVIYKHPWLDLLMQLFVNEYISFFGICLLLAVLSEFIFSVQVSFSVLLSYLFVVNFLKEFYKRHYKKEGVEKQQAVSA
ncbi:MAG: hypothetical protein ACKOU7_10255 [Ferruginibacter sp.]